MAGAEGLWVFGYGSLMWNPGFAAAAVRPARLEGWHRSFCMRSVHHRGTPARPGLVLALDSVPGAACDGLALAVPAGAEEATLAGLRARELVSSAYLETRLPVALGGGASIEAVVFVIDRAHPQYCGGLPLAEQAAIIAGAAGGRGTNPDYLFQTVARLDALGIPDPDLTALAARVRALAHPGARLRARADLTAGPAADTES
ncbi:MAG: gamma-glutamylcyclotransferase [Rhodobacteraceae bacterium]|nr:gamma-glutamylcyclotransferase [Paracoccaceae bacterium]